MSEEDVYISRHKQLLDKIREEANGRPNDQFSRGYAEVGNNSVGETPRRDEGNAGSNGRGSEGNSSFGRTSEGRDTRVRPPERESKRSTKGDDTHSGRSEESVKTRFQLRMPLSGVSDKLFTKEEADAELERLAQMYFRGSGLLDDVLEIIVKDHEPVQIWQMSDEEAHDFATMHLERAMHDKVSARSARKLLEIYDRIYMWMYAVPRVKATGDHIIVHHGLGFR